MDVETYSKREPVLGKHFTREDLHRMGLKTTLIPQPERKLSLKDQQRKTTLEEQQRNKKPLWCPEEEDEALQQTLEFLENSNLKCFAPLVRQMTTFDVLTDTLK